MQERNLEMTHALTGGGIKLVQLLFCHRWCCVLIVHEQKMVIKDCGTTECRLDGTSQAIAKLRATNLW